MLELIENGVTFLHIIVCLLLIAVVLIQPGKSGGISAALGGAGAAQVFGGRGAGNFMSKATWGAAAVFFATSMTLAYISSSVNDSLQSRAAAAEEPAMVAPGSADKDGMPASDNMAAGDDSPEDSEPADGEKSEPATDGDPATEGSPASDDQPSEPSE